MKKYITPIVFIVGIFLLHTALTAGIRILTGILSRGDMETTLLVGRLGAFGVPAIIVGLITVAVIILIVKLRKGSVKETFYLRKPKAKNIGFAILLGLLLAVLSNSYSIARLFSANIDFGHLQSAEISGMLVRSALGLLVGFIVAIIPVVFSELMFRGAIFSEMRKLAKPKLAIAILVAANLVIVVLTMWLAARLMPNLSVLVFLFHPTFVVTVFVGVLVSLVLYTLCYKSNSIWVPIAASVMFASLANVLDSMLEWIILMSSSPRETGDIINTWVYLVGGGIPPNETSVIAVILVTASVAAVIGVVLWRMIANNKKED